MDIRLKLLELSLRQKLIGKGLKGKPIKPQIVSYAVTKACNLKCLHCHANANEAMPNELTPKEAKQAINEMAELGTEVIIFSGGEPLLKKDLILDLTEHCKDLGIITAMLTNGVLLDHKTAWELKEAGMLAVGIPIDFATPERHDALRNMPGAFESAIKAIKACHDIDLKVVITTMALKNNFDEIPQLINLLANLGVEQVVLYDFIPVGRGKELEELAMNQEQRTRLLDYIYKIQEEREMFFLVSGGSPLYPGIILEMHKNYGTKPPDQFLRQFLVHTPVGCHAGLHYFSLRPNGDVYPCPFLQLKVGNIREQSLTDIWYNSKILNELRNRCFLKGKCGECSYKEKCGGCRARAYAQTSDYLASDPNCPIKIFREKKVHPFTIECFGLCVG
ncbi:MAG: radical SAM protein [Candidatus Bathyarchaeales archaeon]